MGDHDNHGADCECVVCDINHPRHVQSRSDAAQAAGRRAAAHHRSLAAIAAAARYLASVPRDSGRFEQARRLLEEAVERDAKGSGHA